MRIGAILFALLGLAVAATRMLGFLETESITPADYAARILGGTTTAVTNEDPVFTDAAPALGVDFVHDMGGRGLFHLPEEMGPGVGLLDFDGDGDLDIFVAGGGVVDGSEPGQECRLYRNSGSRFEDVTDDARVSVRGPCLGVACADYDHDGDVDVVVTRAGPNAVLRNNGDGTFEEVAATVGLADDGFGTSVAFFDYDRDGWLDLYVANYVAWNPDDPPECFSPLGIRDYCNPIEYPPATDRLYRNAGDGTFLDVTEPAGIAAHAGNGLGVVASDFDGDGWPDLYVANDQTPAFLWHNNGDGTFVETAVPSGCAYNEDGIAIAGMGIACEDVDGDRDFDLLVTNIHDQSHLLLLNEGGRFVDASRRSGLGRWSVPATAFGVALFDQDHDGSLDGFFANGEVNVVNLLRTGENPYAQPDQFVRVVNGVFVDATADSGAAFGDVGRGLAAGDLDGDGDLDLVVANNDGPLRVLRNEQRSDRGWLIVDARTNGRAAIGAVVEVETENGTIVRAVRPQQSYLSSGDPRVHVGLGATRSIRRVTITWPDGRVTALPDVEPNSVLLVEQPQEDAP